MKNIGNDDIRCGLYLLEGGLEPKEAVSTVMSLTETLREDPDEALAQMAAIVDILTHPLDRKLGERLVNGADLSLS